MACHIGGAIITIKLNNVKTTAAVSARLGTSVITAANNVLVRHDLVFLTLQHVTTAARTSSMLLAQAKLSAKKPSCSPTLTYV